MQLMQQQPYKYYSTPMFIAFLLTMLFTNTVYARDLIVSLPDRAGLAEMGEDGKPHGSLVDLIQAIDDVYEEGEIIILGLFPFKRSINNVVTGKADFHPVLLSSIEPKGFIYSTIQITTSSSVLYSNADKPKLDHDKLWQYHFDTGRGHAQVIEQKFLKLYNKAPTKVSEFNYIEQGFQRLAAGRTDAIIMEQESADRVLRKLKLKNIRRELLKQEHIHAIVQDSERGIKVDEILTKAFNKLAQQGRFEALSYHIHKPWDDWQPAEMDW